MPSIILKSDDAYPSMRPARRHSSNLLYGTGRPAYDTLGKPLRTHPRNIDQTNEPNNRDLVEYGTSCVLMKPDNEFVRYRSVILK
jgi:hypothetical protein